MDLQAGQRRGEDAGRVGLRDGAAGGIARLEQRTADPAAQRRAGHRIVGPYADDHVEMGRADAQVEGHVVQFVNCRAPSAFVRRAKGDLTGAAAVVDRHEHHRVGERADMERAAPGRD
jgi:hypothetical protein